MTKEASARELASFVMWEEKYEFLNSRNDARSLRYRLVSGAPESTKCQSELFLTRIVTK